MNAAWRPILALLPDRLVCGLCTCGPVGYWGKAPGTNGTVVGLLLYTAVFYPASLVTEVVLLLFLAGIAVLICDEGERRMQKRDPGEMILDEIIAIPLCFLGLKSQMAAASGIWIYMVAVFVLFRFFDILKPLGINRLQRYPGGIGVVLDDLAAALAVNLTLRLGIWGLSYLGWGGFEAL